MLRAAGRGAFELHLSAEILEETRTALTEKAERLRRTYEYPDDKVETFLEAVAALATPVGDLPTLHVVPLDPKDDAIVATAVKARAEYLVSGDRHLLALGEYEGIRIVTPRQFLDLL